MLLSLFIVGSAIGAAAWAYQHQAALHAQQQQQPQCPVPNFAVPLQHEGADQAIEIAPSPVPSVLPATWGSAISSAMWMLFLKRKPLRYHGKHHCHILLKLHRDDLISDQLSEVGISSLRVACAPTSQGGARRAGMHSSCTRGTWCACSDDP